MGKTKYQKRLDSIYQELVGIGMDIRKYQKHYKDAELYINPEHLSVWVEHIQKLQKRLRRYQNEV